MSLALSCSLFGASRAYDHALDPHGDVVLILKNAGAPFAVCAEQDDAPPPAPPSGPPSQNATIVKFLVSSRHLSLASPVFRRQLQGAFSEAKVHDDGLHHLETQDFSKESVLILLNLLHGHLSSVPQSIDLEMLGRLAVLVDYYDMSWSGAVRYFSGMWVGKLSNLSPTTLPKSMGRDLTLWICATWVFGQVAVFNEVATTVVMNSTGRLPCLELPIPERIVAGLERQRVEGSEKIASVIRRLTSRLLEHVEPQSKSTHYYPPAGCRREPCRSVILGSLMTWMHRNEMEFPVTSQSMRKHSLAALIQLLKDFATTPTSHYGSYNRPCDVPTSHYGSYNRPCDVPELSLPSLDRLVSEFRVNGFPAETPPTISMFGQSCATNADGRVRGTPSLPTPR